MNELVRLYAPITVDLALAKALAGATFTLLGYLSVRLVHLLLRVLVSRSSESRIVRLPGSKLMTLAEMIVSPEKYDQVCESVIADWHAEYFDALDQGRGRAKMAFIRIRHTWGFVKAVGLLSVFEVIGNLAKKFIGTVGD